MNKGTNNKSWTAIICLQIHATEYHDSYLNQYKYFHLPYNVIYQNEQFHLILTNDNKKDIKVNGLV